MREALAKLVILGSVFAVGYVSYATIVLPTQEDEARQALARQGHLVEHIAPSAYPVCAKRRTAFAWRSAKAHGVVCVGNFLPPSVSVWP